MLWFKNSTPRLVPKQNGAGTKIQRRSPPQNVSYHQKTFIIILKTLFDGNKFHSIRFPYLSTQASCVILFYRQQDI